MFAFDIWAPAAFLLALLVLPWLGRPVGSAVERGWRAIAFRRGLSVLVVGLVSLAVNSAVTLHRGIPVPSVTDEFSYLLAGDTFAHGRVTNPSHLLWPHFESEEIIQKPTYQSKYQPAQGVFLALGQVLTGFPAAGVLLSLALACAAVCWMLQAWVGERWALVGGLLAALNPGMIDGWGQSYWGGAVAMLGGALLFGGMRRLAAIPHARDAIWVGLGCALLANTRPLEGLVATLVAAAGLIPMLHRQRLSATLRQVVLPLALVLVPTALAMGYYNARVTKSPLVMPYQVWYRTYVGGDSVLSGFFAADPQARHPRILRGARPLTKSENPAPSWEEKRARKRRQLAAVSLGFFLPGVIGLVLLALPGVLRDRFGILALVGVALVFGIVFAGSTIHAPHYSAPVAPLVFALLAACLRRLHVGRCRGRRAGRWIVRAILASFLVGAIVHAAAEPSVPSHAARRMRLIQFFERAGGRHLVVVRYDPTHQATYEWVYNHADIDGSPIAWARELDPPKNRRLLKYFKDRTQWLFDADTLELKPYPAPSQEPLP